MERYIGLDVHMQSTTIAVVGTSGKRIKTTVVDTSGPVLVQAMKAIAGAKHVCLEEGTQSEWLFELLSPHVEEVVVFMAEKSPGTKSDEADAWAMAERFRLGALKTRVFKATGQFTALRSAVMGYGLILSDVVRLKNRLRALYRSRGLHGGGQEIFRLKARAEWEARLPSALAPVVKQLGRQLDTLEELRAEAEQRLLDEGARHSEVRRLATAPAIGPIRAAQIVATIVTPHRFRTKRQLWSYCGLGIVTSSSADYVRGPDGKLVKMRTALTRGLNHNRNPLLKLVFKGAAHQICTLMPAHPLHQHFQRIVAAGTKPNLAKLTIARRLSATVLAMWKHKEDYDAARSVTTAR